MMCKIERWEKMMWPIFMKSNKRNKSQQSFEFTYSIDEMKLIVFLFKKYTRIKHKFFFNDQDISHGI
jgi:hypothetical protein